MRGTKFDPITHRREICLGVIWLINGIILLISYYALHIDDFWRNFSFICIFIGGGDVIFDLIVKATLENSKYNTNLYTIISIVSFIAISIVLICINAFAGIILFLACIIEVAIYIAIPYRWEIKRWIKKKRKAARNKNKKP